MPSTSAAPLRVAAGVTMAHALSVTSRNMNFQRVFELGGDVIPSKVHRVPITRAPRLSGDAFAFTGRVSAKSGVSERRSTSRSVPFEIAAMWIVFPPSVSVENRGVPGYAASFAVSPGGVVVNTSGLAGRPFVGTSVSESVPLKLAGRRCSVTTTSAPPRRTFSSRAVMLPSGDGVTGVSALSVAGSSAPSRLPST